VSVDREVSSKYSQVERHADVAWRSLPARRVRLRFRENRLVDLPAPLVLRGRRAQNDPDAPVGEAAGDRRPEARRPRRFLDGAA
jgi:hypothetical protein